MSSILTVRPIRKIRDMGFFNFVFSPQKKSVFIIEFGGVFISSHIWLVFFATGQRNCKIKEYYVEYGALTIYILFVIFLFLFMLSSFSESQKVKKYMFTKSC